MKKLGVFDTVLLSLMTAVLMIGGHQTYVIAKEEGFRNGFMKSYWIFMILILLMVVYNARTNKKLDKEENGDSVKKNITKGKMQKKNKRQN